MGKFKEPSLIAARLFNGKLPAEAFTMQGPVVHFGQFTWEPTDTSRYPILTPLSGGAAAICFMNGPMAIVASVLPDVDDEVFCSSSKVQSTLQPFLQSNSEVVVLVGDKPGIEMKRGVSSALHKLGIGANRFSVFRSAHSPADHPIIKDGTFFNVDARVIRAMLIHQNIDPAPAWAPIDM